MPERKSNKKSERPPDSDFQQQNLKAWQPLLTPNWVIGTFLFIGLVFLPIGIVIMRETENIKQIEVQYGQEEISGSTISITMNITDDMPTPFFYYKLTEFYQNHRRYVSSRNDKQLRNEVVADLSSCAPATTNGSKAVYPCGLIANSYFNDMFGDMKITRSGSSYPVARTEKGIAWESDVSSKITFDGSLFDPATMTREAESGITMPENATEDFIVWMRTAGLPTFKKLRYKILTDLKKGDVLTFNITNNFDIFDGNKYVVLSTASWLGGKNLFLGLAYIVVGALCLLLALVFLIKHCVSPRPLGDMAYFNWSGSAGKTN